MKDANLMDKIVALAKRRGFIFPGSEIYGGLANTYDFGPLGVELKNNIKRLWWKMFVQERADVVGLDAAIIMNSKVWQKSGHLENFNDQLIECKKCHTRYRAEQLNLKICLVCKGKEFTSPKAFNTMFKTHLGPVEPTPSSSPPFLREGEKAGEGSPPIPPSGTGGEREGVVYLRPETAQAMFVDFKNIVETTRVKVPFGVAQIGKAFRNEITPGNFVFRTREFELMEIEYFVHEKDWKKYFGHWLNEMKRWVKEIGLDENKVEYFEVPEGERAHYSKRTIDMQFKYPFGQEELYGLAYRTDYDLKAHGQEYRDPDTGEKFIPHVIEPALGVERTVLAILLSAYHEEKDRVVLKLNPKIAPYKVAVFPLLANKPGLTEIARDIYNDLKPRYMTAWDDRGNIGKRYYAQDEIGTPFCVTVDFQSVDDKTVTVRDRDTTKQDRIAIAELKNYIGNRIN